MKILQLATNWIYIWKPFKLNSDLPNLQYSQRKISFLSYKPSRQRHDVIDEPHRYTHVRFSGLLPLVYQLPHLVRSIAGKIKSPVGYALRGRKYTEIMIVIQSFLIRVAEWVLPIEASYLEYVQKLKFSLWKRKWKFAVLALKDMILVNLLIWTSI